MYYINNQRGGRYIVSEIIEKSDNPESYLLGVYKGYIETTDEMYSKILNILKARCDENNVSYNGDINSVANTIFNSIVEEVKKENQIELSFNDINNFEEEFINNINKLENMPLNKRVLAIDSIINQDVMHNPTTSIMELTREYISSKMEALVTSVNMLIAQKELDFSNFNNGFDPFADSSTPTLLTEEEQKKYKNELEFFMLLPKFSNIFRVKNKYIEKVYNMRDNFLVEEIEVEYPEYIEELKVLLNQKDENITYYYHGTQSVDDAKNIIDKGLYMQYNEIDRTAKANLSLAQILNYSYGHDNVGRYAIVVIGVPNNESVVDINIDKNVLVSSTNQGLEQGAFNPKYVIHNQYIVGYINKEQKKFIKNPNYIYGDELQNEEKPKVI